MNPRHLGFIAEAARGELRNASPNDLVTGLSTDSRTIGRGDLFVALVGDRFDAHEFITDEIGEIASACVVESARLGGRLAGYPQIMVDDTRVALGRLAASYRQSFDLPIIAVTGSNGKTSTKRFLNAVLSQRFDVCASPASFNNDVGVPLSLLQMGESTQVAVFEVGTNHPGEIRPLVEMIQPGFGVITSIGRSHLEFFGSVEAVAEEKGALGEVLPRDGVLFVNGDTPFLEKLLSRVEARVVRVGFEEWNDWRIGAWEMGREGMEFSIKAEALGGYREFRLHALGRHHLINATLAIAVGAELGLTPDELKSGIAKSGAERMRLEWGGFGGVMLLDDSYNANADSMIAALKTLEAFPCSGARYGVLGDMGELGEFSTEAHAEVGRVAADCQVDHLISVGKWSEVTRRAAADQGAESAVAYANWEAVGEMLCDQLRSGDAVLVKASRAARLDRLVEFLKQALGSEGESVRGGHLSFDAVNALNSDGAISAGRSGRIHRSRI